MWSLGKHPPLRSLRCESTVTPPAKSSHGVERLRHGRQFAENHWEVADVQGPSLFSWSRTVPPGCHRAALSHYLEYRPTVDLDAWWHGEPRADVVAFLEAAMQALASRVREWYYRVFAVPTP